MPESMMFPPVWLVDRSDGFGHGSDYPRDWRVTEGMSLGARLAVVLAAPRRQRCVQAVPVYETMKTEPTAVHSLPEKVKEGPPRPFVAAQP
jgi:hypothetical protein